MAPLGVLTGKPPQTSVRTFGEGGTSLIVIAAKIYWNDGNMMTYTDVRPDRKPLVLDGKACAAEIKDELKAKVSVLKDQGVVPGLGTLLVGEDPGSLKYVAGKHRDCDEIGLSSIDRRLPADASQDDILNVVL